MAVPTGNMSFIEKLKFLTRKQPKLRVEYTGQTRGFYKEAMGWYNDPRSYDPIQQIYFPTNSFFNYPYGIYDEMKGKNTHVRSMLDTRVQTILSKPIRIIPANTSKEALKRRNFIVDMFAQMGRGKAAGDFLHFLKNMQFNGIFYPFAVSEIIWTFDGTFICPNEIKVRHPRNFSWDKEGNKLQFMDTSGLQDLEPGKFVIYAPLRENDHPYKGGLSPLLFSIHNLMWLNIKWWGTSNERGGIPILLVHGAEFMDEPEKDDMEASLDGLKNNLYAFMPDGVDIEAFESKMKAATNTFQDMASFCKREISLAVLGETLTAESTSAGSYSLGAVHQDTLASFVQYDAPQLMEMVNGNLIPQIVAYNFPPRQVNGRPDWLLPKFVIEFEPPEDLQKRLLIDQGALALGVTLSESYIREKYHLPEPVNEEDTLKKEDPSLGNFQSQDPSTTNKPGVDNTKDPSKGLKDQAGTDTNKGRGVNDQVKSEASKCCDHLLGYKKYVTSRMRVFSEAGFNAEVEGVRSVKVMDTVVDTLSDEGEKFIGIVNKSVKRWVDKFENLEEIKALVDNTWYELDIEIGEFEEFIHDGIFQIFTLGYHQLFEDPRVLAAVEDEEKDINKVANGVFSPEEIIAIFEAREVLERHEYDLLDSWAKSRAFTVAGKAKQEILDIIRPIVRTGIYEGRDKAWFVKQTEGILSARHAGTIYSTNFATAFNYGRTDAVFDPQVKDTFAAATYFVVVDDRTTEICLNLVGRVIPIDELSHGQFVPPLHYNCRTVLIFLTNRQYAEIKAPDLLTFQEQMEMPTTIRPQDDFGYYTPVLHVG